MAEYEFTRSMEAANIPAMLDEIMRKKSITLNVAKDKNTEYDFTVKYQENMINITNEEAGGFSLMYIDVMGYYMFHYIDASRELIDDTEKKINNLNELKAKLDEATNLIERHNPVPQPHVFHHTNMPDLETRVDHLSRVVLSMIDLLETITSKVSEHDLQQWKHELSQ